MGGRRFLYPADSARRVSPSDCKLAERSDKMQSCYNSPMLMNGQPIGIPGDRRESGKVWMEQKVTETW